MKNNESSSFPSSSNVAAEELIKFTFILIVK